MVKSSRIFGLYRVSPPWLIAVGVMTMLGLRVCSYLLGDTSGCRLDLNGYVGVLF